VTRRHFFTYLSLSTMALSQPILDLYGRNITVFSAAKLSTVEVIGFIVLVALVPALGAATIDAFSRRFGPRVNESTRLVLLGFGSVFLGLAVARWVGVPGDVPAVLFAVIVGVGVPWAFDRSRSVREWSRWLAVLSLVVVGNAVFQVQPVVTGTDGDATDAVVSAPSMSVLHIVFDEFPVYPLLDSTEAINAERYPGFAALAAGSTWYRDAVAASNFTHQAVPALLSSTEPKSEGGPFLADYPRNIFTLFRGKVDVRGVEPVTSLCPVSMCTPPGGEVSSLDAARFARFVRDAAYVYGQRVLPPTLRKKIPSTDGAWGGFNAVAEKFKEQFAGSALPQLDALERAVSLHVRDDEPRVSVVHVLAPHAPWRLTPDLRVTPQSPEISTKNPDDEDGVRDTYQAFLHQLAATDRVVAEMIDDLKASGRWDDTLLVVSADHGISFRASQPQRHTDFSDMGQSDDIFRVPLFVKYPGQKAGETSDCPVSNLDIVPTIVDVTDTKTSWTFDGVSLAGPCPTDRVREVRSATGETAVLSEDFQAVVDRVGVYDEMVDADGPVERVAAVGRSASLIGTQMPKTVIDDRIVSWTLTQRKSFDAVAGSRGTSAPGQVTGTIELSRPLPSGTEGILAVSGRAAAVLGELSGAEGTVKFTAILDHRALTPGAHTVQLWVRTPDGSLSRAPD
jgi:hypothetical protein